MQYRPYGSTGRMVSVLGISTADFHEKKEIDKYSSSIVHAFEKGVNYFDSSPFARQGIGEKALSNAIVEMKKTGQDPPPLAEIEKEILRDLKEEKKTGRLKQWINDLREHAEIEIDRDLLYGE